MGSTAKSIVSLLDGATETPLHSSVTGPIASLSWLRQSLLFAELSNLSYLARADAGRLACRIGFPEIRFYNHDGAQAYIFGNDEDAVVVCRGTEPNDWNDVRADLNLRWTKSETVGRVHFGFKREVDDVWPRLEQALANNRRTLWFAGHSLGGAMAAICAGRCVLSSIRSNPSALFTYGSPRIGTGRYVNHVRLEAYRWVNNNDIVTRVPPIWLGYRHKGQEIYLDSRGEIRDVQGWRRAVDRWRGFILGVWKGRVDHFADHAVGLYIESIWNAVQCEERVILPMRRSAPQTSNLRGRAAA